MDEIYTHQEFPKWVYRTDGPQESYEAGTEPLLVESAEEEAALKPKRGRKAKAETTEAALKPKRGRKAKAETTEAE